MNKKFAKSALLTLVTFLTGTNMALAIHNAALPNPDSPTDQVLVSETNGEVIKALTETSDGNFVASFLSTPSPGTTNIRAQKINSTTGAFIWSTPAPTIASPTSGTFYEMSHQIAPDLSGGFYISWTEGSYPNQEIYVQHVDTDGNTTFASNVNITTDDGAAGAATGDISTVASDGSGGAYIIFRAITNNAYIARIDSTGSVASGWNTSGTGTFRPIQLPGPNGSTPNKAITDSSGNVIIVFTNSATSTFTSYATKYAPDGTLAASPWNGPLTLTDADSNIISSVIHDTGDGFMYAYTDNSGNVRVGHIQSDGSTVSGWGTNGTTVSGPGSNSEPVLASDTTGGAIVSWRNDDGVTTEVLAHHVLNTGSIDPSWSNPLAVSSPTDGFNEILDTNGYYILSPITEDGLGGAYVAFTDYLDYTVRMQHINSDGTLEYSRDGLTFGDNTSNLDSSPTLISNSSSALAIWQAVEADNDIGYQLVTDVSVRPHSTMNLAGTGGDSQVALAWTAPDNDGPAISDYIIQYKTAAYPSIWQTFADGTSSAANATVTGLTNGTAYYFRIYAVNGIGTGTQSNYALATPAASGSTLAQWPSTSSPANILVNRTPSTSENHRYPRIVQSSDSNYITTWVDSRDIGTTATDIYAQKLSATDGARLWGTDDKPVVTATGDQPDSATIGTNNIAIAADSAGGAFVAWDDDRDYPTATDVYIQHLDTNGALVAGWPTDGLKIEVDTSAATAFELSPQILSDGSDGVFITWSALASDFSGSVAYITHVAGDGTIDSDLSTVGLQPPFALPHAAGFPFDLAMSIQSDGAGGSVTTFVNADFTVTAADDLYAVRLDADGVLASGWTSSVLLNSTGIENLLPTSFNLKTIPDGTGGIITAYNYQDTGDSLIYTKAQRIDGTGAVQWGSGTMILSTGSTGSAPDLATDGSGGAVITWTDYRNDPETDVYAQRISSTGAVQWTTNGIAISDTTDGLIASFPAGLGTYIVPEAATPGDTIITFTSDTGSALMQVNAQKLDIDGNALWTAFGEPVATAADTFAGNAVLTSDAGTGAVFAWEGQGAFSNYNIYAQHFMETPTGPTPTAVQNLTAVAGDEQVALDWDTPASDGGSAITDYRIEYRVGTQAYATFADGVSTATNATVTGLTNFINYEFRVRAINANGLGDPATVNSMPVPCTSMDDNTQTSSSPLTTISDQCIGATVAAGALSFENIPDSFSFPRKFRALTAQNSFSNDDPATLTTVDVTTGPEDVLTVSDFRNNGDGFTVNITATGVDSASASMPLHNLYVLTTSPDSNDLTDATLVGTVTQGVEYAAGSTGTQDIWAQLNADGSNLSIVSPYLIKGYSFDADSDNVPDIVPVMDTSTGHMLRASLDLSFYQNVPANQVAGTYSTLLTLDLQPNP